MIKQKLDDLIDILADKFADMENTFVISNNKQLAEYIKNPEQWKQKQMAHRLKYKRDTIRTAKEQLDVINKTIEKVMLLSYKQVADDLVEITETEIKVHKIPDDLKEKIKQMQKNATKDVLKLANASYSSFNHSIKIIGDSKTYDDLFQAIEHQTAVGIDNGIKIAYTDKAGHFVRNMSWKSYMEMKARTDIHTEMSDQQIKAGERVGQVFYCTDNFSDCAKDHAEFQGLMFYDENVEQTDEIKAYIQSHKCMSVQEAKEQGLTTRPNCRHEFHAVPLSEVIDENKTTKEIQKAEGFYEGDYKSQNYDKVQEQRKNERMIRKYKLRVKAKEEMARQQGGAVFKPSKEDRALIRKWQQKQVELEKQNPDIIKRNYEREKINTIVNDLGVKYYAK